LYFLTGDELIVAAWPSPTRVLNNGPWKSRAAALSVNESWFKGWQARDGIIADMDEASV